VLLTYSVHRSVCAPKSRSRRQQPENGTADYQSSLFAAINDCGRKLSELPTQSTTNDCIESYFELSSPGDVGGLMAIRTPRQLAILFRHRALCCEKAASEEHVRPEHRAVLLKTAEHYRMLAHNINEPVGKWDALMRSYGLLSA
jgi:hypothetical protein